MRQLRKNKRSLYYANYSVTVPIYNGTTIVDGVERPIKVGIKQGYETPIEFKANLSVNSGETTQSEYGLNVGDYNAIISAEKGKLPFNERTLIWHKSEPQYNQDGSVMPESADYRVIAIKTSLNEERFILKARIEDNA